MDVFNLENGYEGTAATAKGQNGKADAQGQLARKMTEILVEGPNKGSFAKSGQAVKIAVGNTIAATATTNSNDAARTVKFTGNAANAEDDARGQVTVQQGQVSDHASDITSKIIPL